MTIPPTCCHCGRVEDHTLDTAGKWRVELRPYGPGGAWVCFECGTATPEREAETSAAFGALLGVIEASGKTPCITESGIVPFESEES